MAGFSLDGKGFAAASLRFAAAAKSIKKAQIVAVRRAALITEAEIKKGLRSGAPGGVPLQPLSPFTRLLRRGTKPLLDQGFLLGSITTTVNEDSGEAFVGVHRTARGPDGESLVNVAAVHEFGTPPFVIPVTPGVRRFFIRLSIESGGAISPLSAGKTEILHPGVPARPFIRPTIEAIRERLRRELGVAIEQSGGII